MMTPSDHEIFDTQPDLVFDDYRPASDQMEFDFDTIVVDDPESTRPMSSDDGADAADSSASVTEDIEEGAPRLDTETDQDMDLPLYGDEDGCTFDWKSLGPHLDLDSVEAENAEDVASDGCDNTTATEETDSSSDGEESDPDSSPDGSRMDDGWVPSTQVEFDSDESDRSDRSGVFSSVLDDDADEMDWIPPIYPESVVRESLSGAGKPYEQMVTKDGTVKVTALRARFFARYVVLKANLHNHHGIWYGYFERYGIWKPLNEAMLLNVADKCITEFGEQLDLEGFGRLCSVNFCLGVIRMMVPVPGYENIFDSAPTYAVTFRNKTLTFDSQGNVTMHEHSPNFLSRAAFDLEYDPTVDTREFVEFAFPTVENKEEIPVIQMVAGQCLLGVNIAQKILQLYGDADAGKTQTMKLFQHVLGSDLWTNLIPEKVKRPFELASYDGMHALFAPDETGDAMLTSGGRFMKGAVGEDPMTGELKFSNERNHFNGAFNIITTSNAVLQVPIEEDHDAWWRRLLIVRYKGKPRRKIKHFARYAINHYGKEVAKWMADGVVQLRLNGGDIPVPPTMAKHIDEVLQKSDPYLDFVKTRVVHTDNRDDRLTTTELFVAFKNSGGVKSDMDKTMKTKLKKAMLDAYGVKTCHHLPDSKGNIVNLYLGFKLVKEGCDE